MSGRISYMGTKHDLAGPVAGVIAGCKPGRLLDAFAGMGAVAATQAGKRQVWTNDVQHFAHLVSQCRFTDPDGPVDAERMRELTQPVYQGNLDCLQEQNLSAWSSALVLPKVKSFAEFTPLFSNISEQQVSHKDAYGCFLSLYANSYFSLIQCAEIDSIRCALDTQRGRGNITGAQFDWAVVSLGHAALRSANTTGHFAQALQPSGKNFKRVTKQFGRSIFETWIESLSIISPSGTSEWRSENIATRSDCSSLLQSISEKNDLGVVYCDPPYTNDHYSRYYHVWETLVLYDYPVVSGQGRYRPDRFATDFSLKGKVEAAFETLVKEVTSTSADLVLSYPSNGLLYEAGGCPLEIMRSHYPNAKLIAEIEHNHSTMGASKGQATASVAERIFIGRA